MITLFIARNGYLL